MKRFDLIAENGVLTFDEFANILDGRQEVPKFNYSQLREQFDMFDRVGSNIHLIN